MTHNKHYKLILVGDGGAGKTTWVQAITNQRVSARYVPTLGVEVTPFTYVQDNVEHEFSIWDTAGQEKYGGLREGYYIQANAAIVFLDLSSRITFENCREWINNVRKVRPNIPIVLCGAKNDIAPQKVTIQEMGTLNVDYVITISSFINSSIYNPLSLIIEYLKFHN